MIWPGGPWENEPDVAEVRFERDPTYVEWRVVPEWELEPNQYQIEAREYEKYWQWRIYANLKMPMQRYETVGVYRERLRRIELAATPKKRAAHAAGGSVR